MRAKVCDQARSYTRTPACGARDRPRLVLDQALAAAAPAVDRPPSALEPAATTAIRYAVLAGAGPAVLSVLAVRDDLATRRLVRIRVDGLDLRRELRGVWPEGPSPTGPARELLRIAGSRLSRAAAGQAARPGPAAAQAGPTNDGDRG
jgi:DNA-binding transcriptional LysR family regulator